MYFVRAPPALLQAHLFFKHMDWADVINRKLEPPFKPALSSDDDVSQEHFFKRREVIP